MMDLQELLAHLAAGKDLVVGTDAYVCMEHYSHAGAALNDPAHAALRQALGRVLPR